jgi:hypothetical protein
MDEKSGGVREERQQVTIEYVVCRQLRFEARSQCIKGKGRSLPIPVLSQYWTEIIFPSSIAWQALLDGKIISKPWPARAAS